MKEFVLYLILTLTSGTESKLELDRTSKTWEDCEKNIPIFESYIAQKGYSTMTDVIPNDVVKTQVVCITEDAKPAPALTLPQ